MIFLFKAAQNLVARHYVKDFFAIFHFKVAQNLVAEHYDREFELFSSLLRRLKIVVAERYERDFDMLFYVS